MHVHVQAMNEYRGGEILTEVVVDQDLWTEIVDRRRKWKCPASMTPWLNFLLACGRTLLEARTDLFFLF